MGKPIDKNKPTKNFDELLEHLKKPVDDLDAFEQEAMEGFAMLESKQEALDIKKRLDERMEEKFSEKRKPLFIYWSAAAGIALIIGLIFLVRSNGNLKSDEVADNSVVSKAQLEGKLNSPAETPAELKQQTTKESAAKGSKQDKGEFGGESNAQMGKNAGPAQKMAEEQMADAKANAASVTTDEVSESLKEGEKDLDNKRADVTKPADDLAKSPKKDQVPAAAAGAGSNDGNSPLNNEKAKTKDKEDEDADNDKATGYFSRKIKKEKKAEPAATETKPKVEAETSFEKSNIKLASLTIKETDLQQRIDKFFKDKDYKKSFVCTLTIDADDIVESVVFQNPDIFSKSQKKELTEFLLKLKCFKNHEFSVYSTYLLNYKAQ
jgi:hypothetical protein